MIRDDWTRRWLPPKPQRRATTRRALMGLIAGASLCALVLILWGIAAGVGALTR